ncbi:TetR/AcrR family transcriptional regulator [Octadecabacter sp. R77987]|uniref:TetR/AcrR family transcriptional regulator n=1 Tax=Octadecabacter sp. R77987 TaxID=3093874 RepID=UPI00366C501F
MNEALQGNTKVTRADWLRAALDALVTGGAERVKILTLANTLGVSRSSFYWYFQSRQDLMDALLDHWLATNTRLLVDAAATDAPTITAAVCNVFACFIDPTQFDTRLDFAVRDWAKRTAKVRDVLMQSDDQRIAALTDMFTRFGYGAGESLIRARVLYYMQIGYNDADLHEPLAARMAAIPDYLLTFTGRIAPEAEIATYRTRMSRIMQPV